MIPMSHLSFVQCEQIKFRPKKNVKMKISHSVVAVGIVAVGGGARDGWGINVMSNMTWISAISLICLVLPFLIRSNIFNNLK